MRKQRSNARKSSLEVWTRDGGSNVAVAIKAKPLNFCHVTKPRERELNGETLKQARGKDNAPFTHYKAPRKSGLVSGGYVQGSYRKLVNW